MLRLSASLASCLAMIVMFQGASKCEIKVEASDDCRLVAELGGKAGDDD